MPSHDVIVIGAGAAGMMCAAVAGQRGRRVLLIDHFPKLGEKIRISGGGRCNFTNIHASAANYLSQDRGFCADALARYTPRDFIALVERHRIAYHEKTLGQLFCDRSATEIIALLRSECAKGGVEWQMPCSVASVAHAGGSFAVRTAKGTFAAPKLVIATGGLTVPKLGATPLGYRIAEQFGLAVVPPRPALVPLAFAPDALTRYGELSGISLPVAVSCGDATFHEDLLFTHRGLSGPAILQISSYWNGKEPLHINLLPTADARALLDAARTSNQRLDNVLGAQWPRRLAQRWVAAQDALKTMRDFTATERAALGAAIHDWQVLPSGTLGYQKAEVTLGGVDTRALSPRTLAAHAMPNLHFVGEVVDVTGWLGGYNFQWAWSSGYAAGSAV